MTAVTDRRVIDVETGDTAADTTIESFLLSDDRIVGVSCRQGDEEPPTALLAGGVAVVLGAVLVLGLLLLNGGGPTFGLLAGAVLSAVGTAGVVLSVTGEDPTGGDVDAERTVTVTVESAAGDRTWELPPGEEAVPRAISRVVAEHNR